ncbi:leucine-rich repeat flightless-interacting protein 1 isoform X2 [Lampris incognitus]|uniref:leucine-rich repeat flightless-interacting protein 1 isoform X2 n=1 Tax=Lampris incognitus TaxID=2546036 RepID=UPI0024B5FA0B|nr:leucine-rich repeat flightless-interacting protein 1 isoform X2 [Lampris incognitus]
MYAISPDRNASPKKKTLSRGMSEDESLRSIIKETDCPSRRLSRADSRGGTLKKRTGGQSDQDLFMGLPEMGISPPLQALLNLHPTLTLLQITMSSANVIVHGDSCLISSVNFSLELQASYDEVVQELHGLEVEREGLLFQVDILQDTLEGVEELLAEAQREAGQANMELEREREARKKWEDMVCSLTQELERLKEERSATPAAPAHMTGGERTRENEVTGQIHPVKKEDSREAFREDNVGTSSLMKYEEMGKGEGAEHNGSPLTKPHRMASKTTGQLPTLELGSQLTEEGIYRRPYESQEEDGRDLSPENSNDTDSISAYEDATAETPEQDDSFPEGTAPGTEELPDDALATVDEKGKPDHCHQDDSSEPSDPRSPDSCILS